MTGATEAPTDRPTRVAASTGDSGQSLGGTDGTDAVAVGVGDLGVAGPGLGGDLDPELGRDPLMGPRYVASRHR